MVPSLKNGVTDQVLKLFNKQLQVLEFRKLKKFRDSCSGYKARFFGRYIITMIYKFLGGRRLKEIKFLTSATIGGEVYLLPFHSQGKSSGYLGHEIW
jgi:hypothetical protein